MKILHVASEVYPLVKTGGLADVVFALPRAQKALGMTVRLLVPGYPAVLDELTQLKPVADVGSVFGAACVRVLSGKLEAGDLEIYVVDSPSLFGRSGKPYTGPDGKDWADNHKRFGLLAWIGAHLADGDIDRAWRPDIVHAHDWHAGLTPAYMAENPAQRAKSVFTIHNLAFRGLFPFGESADLGFSCRSGLPHQFEFFGYISFLKAGLRYANKVTTVSPTYAREILTESMGFSMQGVLKNRGSDFTGILNGLDYDVWNPETDQDIKQTYSAKNPAGKLECKRALRQEFGLEQNDAAPLFGVVSRLADQKGLDLVLAAIPQILALGGQLLVLGSGDPALEQGFSKAAMANPGRIACYIGYDEKLSHRLIAGVDSLLVPSRFEPCGLTQIMALRYGTLPVVRRTGGLADTIEQVTENSGDGFLFDDPKTDALCGALRAAAGTFSQPDTWSGAIQRAMEKNFSWDTSASRYAALYKELLG